MINKLRKLTDESIRFATSMARQYADNTSLKVHNFMVDADQDHRLSVPLCKTCCYMHNDIVSGQAMTAWYCGICEAESMWGNTHTPRVCETCAKQHSLCQMCGGDINMDSSRKKLI